MADQTIKKAEIVESDDWRKENAGAEYPNGNKTITAEMEDGSKELVFHFYDDEIGFRPEELVGLTVSQAVDLKIKRDTAYLRS